MKNRDQLQDSYIHHLLEGMGGRDLEAFFLGEMVNRLESLSDSTLLEEITSYAPELLEGDK